MVEYLLICRSLTYAQRTGAVLERVGIRTRIRRAPKAASAEGCGYAVTIAERDLTHALTVLKSASLSPKRIFLRREGEAEQEVQY